MIEIRCCYQLSEAEPFRDAINALNLASVRPDPFSTFEYYERFLRNTEWFPAREKSRLWLLLVFDRDELVGYLALKQRIERVFGLHARKVEFLTGQVAGRPHAVIQPTREKQIGSVLYEYLLRRKKEWSLLEFHQQDDESALLPPPPEASSGSFRLFYWPTWANSTIAIRWTSLGDYFAALPKKFRSNLSRQIRVLMSSGDVQVLSSSDPKSLAALFELYLSVDAHSWKDQAGPASGNPQWDTYYAGLVEPNQLMKPIILILLLGGVPIAGLICGAFNKRLYALNIVYDDRFARLAPGSVVLFLGVRMAIEGGYNFFDLLSGFGYYKVRWLAQTSETRSVQIYHRGSLHFLKRTLGDAKRRWSGNVVKSDTALSNTIRHSVERDEPVHPKDTFAGWSMQDERERYAASVAKAQCGCGEFLSSEQLSTAMPFDTYRRVS